MGWQGVSIALSWVQTVFLFIIIIFIINFIIIIIIIIIIISIIIIIFLVTSEVSFVLMIFESSLPARPGRSYYTTRQNYYPMEIVGKL